MVVNGVIFLYFLVSSYILMSVSVYLLFDSQIVTDITSESSFKLSSMSF